MDSKQLDPGTDPVKWKNTFHRCPLGLKNNNQQKSVHIFFSSWKKTFNSRSRLLSCYRYMYFQIDWLMFCSYNRNLLIGVDLLWICRLPRELLILDFVVDGEGCLTENGRLSSPGISQNQQWHILVLNLDIVLYL